jgi:hypothetical protein
MRFSLKTAILCLSIASLAFAFAEVLATVFLSIMGFAFWAFVILIPVLVTTIWNRPPEP